MDAISPTARQRNRPALERAPMAFEWRRCPRHPWLGVSVLITRTAEPRCILEDGTAHPVALEPAA